MQKVVAPGKPFFVYYAPGATHAPHHPKKEWIDKYKGKLDQGWDKVREETLARQKALGVVPGDTEFLWRVSRLELRLTPTHPDRAGGLGFLGAAPAAFAMMILAQSVFLSAIIANRIFFHGATLGSFRYELAAFAILQLAMVLGPLVVFAPKLLALKRLGRRQYDALAARYTREFHDKWVEGGAAPVDEPLLGSADIQSLADLASSCGIVQEIGAIPFGRGTIVQVIVVTALPLLPLALTVVPLAGIFKKLLALLL